MKNYNYILIVWMWKKKHAINSDKYCEMINNVREKIYCWNIRRNCLLYEMISSIKEKIVFNASNSIVIPLLEWSKFYKRQKMNWLNKQWLIIICFRLLNVEPSRKIFECINIYQVKDIKHKFKRIITHKLFLNYLWTFLNIFVYFLFQLNANGTQSLCRQ